MEIQQVPVVQGSHFLHNFGIVDGGGELMRLVWHQMEHVFAVWRKGDTVLPSVHIVPVPKKVLDASLAPGSPVSSPEPTVHFGLRLPNNLLDKHPLDFLVVKRISDSKNQKSGQVFHWERTVEPRNTELEKAETDKPLK